MLAGTRERLDWLKMAKARGRYLGMDLEIISVDEAARLFPLLEKNTSPAPCTIPSKVRRSLWRDPRLCQVRAESAAPKIVRHTRVIDLKPRTDGTWDVITDHGKRSCGTRGERRRPVGPGSRAHGRHRTARPCDGASVPHHRGHAGAGRQAEQLHAIDFEGEIYIRQERGGMLMGPMSARACPGRR